MSIVIVRGPDRLHAPPAPPASLPSPVMHGLARAIRPRPDRPRRAWACAEQGSTRKWTSVHARAMTPCRARPSAALRVGSGKPPSGAARLDLTPSQALRRATPADGFPDPTRPVRTRTNGPACCAGKTIALRSCASERELLQTLTLCRRTQVELVLLDPGACSASPRLQALLAQQPLPYIEVHDDPPGQPEACLPDASGRRVGRAQGYGAHSYTLALSLALEHLGCSELDDVHVGT